MGITKKLLVSTILSTFLISATPYAETESTKVVKPNEVDKLADVNESDDVNEPIDIINEEEANKEVIKKSKKQKKEQEKKIEEEENEHKETDIGLENKKSSKEQVPAAVEAVNKGASVLLPRGSLILEPSIEYSRSSAVRVAAEGLIISPINLLGVFDIREVNRDTITGAISTRFGLHRRFELGVRVPYVYRNDKTVTKPVGGSQDVLTETDTYDLGDVEVSARYQMNNGVNGWPFLIAGLRYKTVTGKDPFGIAVDSSGLQSELPTGSGFYSLQPSITVIHPSDPVVFFGSAGYTFNFERNIGGDYGKIDPGDSINLSYGMGFSVNQKASFSLGYSHNTVFETEQNGGSLRNSEMLQVGSLNLGYAYRYNKKTSLTLNLSAGLTNDAPDVAISLRVPFRIDNIF